MLAQYEHSLSLANARVEEATQRNCGLMEALTLLERVGAPFPGASRGRTGSFSCAGAAKPNSKHTACASIASKGQLCQAGGLRAREARRQRRNPAIR